MSASPIAVATIVILMRDCQRKSTLALTCNVRLWHLADIEEVPANVRYWG